MNARRPDPHPTPTDPVVLHPQPGEGGQPVVILQPSHPTAWATWTRPDATAVVVPCGPMPPTLHGVAFGAWKVPTTASGWEALAEASAFEEPVFGLPAGAIPAAGVVILEPDGRIWMVGPTNRFGGHALTFPKGRLDGKSLRAAALAEAWEDSGLQLKLLGHLMDQRRSLTFTRYYLARRIGGSPADMGWESQCVVLTLPDQVPLTALSAYDQAVMAMAKQHLAKPDGSRCSQ